MFIVSTPALVIAQCKAGIVGSFPALNARPASLLDDWLAQITAELSAYSAKHPELPVAPFAVNQIVHASNDRLEHDVRLCVFHDVINLRHAQKAAEQGVDGIIAVCAGAGGHAGVLSPFALVKEIRSVFSGTLILAGAMSTGADVLAAQALGADLAYLGTRFIATEEANASPAYKQMLVASRAEEIVYTPLFSGVAGNYLRASVIQAGFDPDRLPEATKNAMNFASTGTAERKAWKDIWSAGQSVSGIQDILAVQDLVARMAEEYAAARARIDALAAALN